MLSFLLAITSYFAAYPAEAREALAFFTDNRTEFLSETRALSPSERRIAAAVVAPEVSQYSSISDFFELRSLFAIYLYQGRGDFSVGVFQMKPSFAERMEKEMAARPELRKKYASWAREIPKGDDTAARRARLSRLSSSRWQMRYLVLFIETARRKTASIRFASDEQRLLHYATLYNSGVDISTAKVAQMRKKKLFPHGRRTHNYADAALEFFPLINFAD